MNPLESRRTALSGHGGIISRLPEPSEDDREGGMVIRRVAAVE
jgi:hypothetical protein